jgi:hypothetical protein
MCVEYDQRATDSRVKTGIQNLLGGLVLGAIPLGAVALISLWGTVVSHSVRLDAFSERVGTLEQFRSAGGRYTANDGARDRAESIERDNREAGIRSDGDALLRARVGGIEGDIMELSRAVREHSDKAGPLIQQIHHNTEEINRIRGGKR